MELIAAASVSPFNIEIREVRLPEGFKLSAIKAYEGKFDLQDHLDYFNDLMELYLVSKLAKCMVFVVTLITDAKKWFRVIQVGMISS